jgi:tetratricopeptide (TPR) repeat protein
LEKEDYLKSREFFEKAHEVDNKAGAKYCQMYDAAFVAWSYIELGEIEKANNLINTVYIFAHEIKDKLLIGVAEALKGMMFRSQKKWEESIVHFEKSLQEFEFINARQLRVYLFAKIFLFEYARVYRERDQKGDREKAHNLLDQALELFRKLGAKKDIEKTMMLIEGLHPPTQIREKPVGPTIHEYSDVQCNFLATPKELKIGESFELEIEITNTSKKGALLLTKITEVIPEGFAVVKKPELYRMEGNCLNMKEKRLDPSKTEEVKLVLTPKIQGTFHIKPKILYIDADGKEKTHEPKPTSITVKELGIKGWLKGER